MNAQKAREFFSAYHDGTLDRALRQSFERRLKADAELEAEYREFEAVMRRLDALKNVSVDVPADLHERISAKLDKHIYESKRKATSGLGAWWKSLVLGGAACAFLVVAILAVNSFGDERVSTAGTPVVTQPPVLVEENGSLRLQFELPKRAQQTTLVVRDAISGSVLSETVLAPGAELDRPITNGGDDPALMSLEFGDGNKILVAVPGRRQAPETSGTGALTDYALALASRFKVFVRIDAINPAEKATWTFDGTDPMATKATSGDQIVSLSRVRGSLYKISL